MAAFSQEGGVFKDQYLQSAAKLNSQCGGNLAPLTFKASSTASPSIQVNVLLMLVASAAFLCFG